MNGYSEYKKMMDIANIKDDGYSKYKIIDIVNIRK